MEYTTLDSMFDTATIILDWLYEGTAANSKTPENKTTKTIVPANENKTCCAVQPKKKHAEPKHVIFNNPATVIIWEDGSKTVVKCGNNDTFDKEKGFMAAYLKHEFGNDNSFNKFIKKYCED